MIVLPTSHAPSQAKDMLLEIVQSAEQPATGFAELLHSAGVKGWVPKEVKSLIQDAVGIDPETALPFDALGMFGMNRSVEFTSSSDGRLSALETPPQDKALTSFEGDPIAYISRISALQLGTPRPSNALAGEAEKQLENRLMTGPGKKHAQPGPQAADTMSTVNEALIVDQAEDIARPGRSTLNVTANKANRPSDGPFVSVSGTETAVQVVMRVNAETAEQRSRLRLLAEEIAREFDVHLSGVQVDGESTTPDFQTIIRGRHGHSAT